MSATDMPMPGDTSRDGTVIASCWDGTSIGTEGYWLMELQARPPFYRVSHIDPSPTYPNVLETATYPNIIDAADKWREETQ